MEIIFPVGLGWSDEWEAFGAANYEAFGELRLDEKDVSEEQIIDAMIEHPVLINRPIVTTPDAARLCRPSRMVKGFLSEVARR